MFAGGLRPHLYCLPLLKRERDREALVDAAASGDPRFFLGTDSAPHARSAKEAACGCAGVFSAHAALECYAEAFERGAGARRDSRHSRAFTARISTDCRGTRASITLERTPWTVPARYPFGDGDIVPLFAGERLAWKLPRPAPPHERRLPDARPLPRLPAGRHRRRDRRLQSHRRMRCWKSRRYRRSTQWTARRGARRSASMSGRLMARGWIRPRSRSTASIPGIRCGSPRPKATRSAPCSRKCAVRSANRIARRAILVGHNASFDLGFLNAAVARGRNPAQSLPPVLLLRYGDARGSRLRSDGAVARGAGRGTRMEHGGCAFGRLRCGAARPTSSA